MSDNHAKMHHCHECGAYWAEWHDSCPVCPRIARMRRCISFLSSAVKSGEPWTDECEEMVNDALSPKGGEAERDKVAVENKRLRAALYSWAAYFQARDLLTERALVMDQLKGGE
jgi:predicted ATP-dependent serine protease